MDYVLGIDGGGTKTDVVCMDLSEHVVSRRRFSSFNINVIGAKGLEQRMKEIADWAFKQGKCLAVCIGAAGYSNFLMKEIIQQFMMDRNIALWTLLGDDTISWYGALHGEAGVILESGTGSFCYGRNKEGEIFRAGGWGHRIGDEGSGYALGRDLLHVVSHWYDGYGTAENLAKAIKEKASLCSRQEILAYVYGKDESKIADLASIVLEMAFLGDKEAEKIVEKNVQDLCQLVEAVYDKLNMTKEPVVLMGGILENESYYDEKIRQELHKQLPSISFRHAIESPDVGAAWLALELVKKRE